MTGRTLHPPPPPPGWTMLRTCHACRRQAEPVSFANVQDPEALPAAWARLEADGWHTDARGNQRCGACREKVA